MTMTTHTTIGAAIGYGMGNPVLGFVIGFASHLLVDMIPHGDSILSVNFRVHKKKRKLAVTYVTVDSVVAIFMLLLFFNIMGYQSVNAFSATIAGSVMPDLLVGLHDLTKNKYLNWFKNVHFYFHDFFVKKTGDIKLRYGIIGQIVLIIMIINTI